MSFKAEKRLIFFLLFKLSRGISWIGDIFSAKYFSEVVVSYADVMSIVLSVMSVTVSYPVCCQLQSAASAVVSCVSCCQLLTLQQYMHCPRNFPYDLILDSDLKVLTSTLKATG
jgi:hypothetical protein